MLALHLAIIAEATGNDGARRHAERIVVVEALEGHGDVIVENSVTKRVAPILLRSENHLNIKVGQASDV